MTVSVTCAVVPVLTPSPLGAWTIHIVIIICLKVFYDSLPGVSQETSWTLTNISYMAVRSIPSPYPDTPN